MPDRLDGVRAKINRAGEHFDELKREVRAFLDSGAYSIEERRSEQKVEWIARVSGQPPPRIAAIIGDVVHNLRAALDLLVWQLVLNAGGTPTSSTAFPIGVGEADWRAKAKQATRGVSAEVRAELDAIRPWKGANDSLYRLHRLDIVDKHRLLMTVGAANHSVGFRLPLTDGFSSESPTLFVKPADKLFPIQDGVLVAADYSESAMDPPVIVFELAFGDEETVMGENITEALGVIFVDVEATVVRFEPMHGG